jgi:hypothetical protein
MTVSRHLWISKGMFKQYNPNYFCRGVVNPWRHARRKESGYLPIASWMLAMLLIRQPGDPKVGYQVIISFNLAPFI